LSTDRTPTSDEVLRRVGRNLVIFQQIEHFLKFLLSSHQTSGTAETLQANAKAQAECISTKTLGVLVEKYKTEILHDAGEEIPEVERPAGWFSFSYRLSVEKEFLDSLHNDLKVMTDERNALVHHFLPRWQPGSDEGMAEALAYLDTQREKVLPMFEHLKRNIEGVEETRRYLQEFIKSPEYEKQFELMWIQSSPLIELLHEVAQKFCRKDGWTYLAHAGDLAAKELPDEVKALKERYGYKTLKKLLIGSEMFDVLDEPLSDGRFRTLYKVRQEEKAEGCRNAQI